MRTCPQPRTERYALEHGHYVLYVGETRALITHTVAVLIDTRLGMLITHGDPASVRRELDAMRQMQRGGCTARYDEDWLLMEGRPQLEGLNAVLSDAGGIDEIRQAYAGETTRNALTEAQALILRISQRGS